MVGAAIEIENFDNRSGHTARIALRCR
jgi:hypothetical protein